MGHLHVWAAEPPAFVIRRQRLRLARRAVLLGVATLPPVAESLANGGVGGSRRSDPSLPARADSGRPPTTPPGRQALITNRDSLSTINDKIASLGSGDSAVFAAGSYVLGGTILGKPGVTLWAQGGVTLRNGDIDCSGKRGWTVRGLSPGNGFLFAGGRINAAHAGGGWAIANCSFDACTARRGGFAGSAIHLDNARDGDVINCDFHACEGTVVGYYNLSDISFDGLHFTDCQQPYSIQVPVTDDRRYGSNLVWQRCVFAGTGRAAIEIGPTDRPLPGERFDGTVVSNCHFDDFKRLGAPPGDGQLLAISLVGITSIRTTVTNNFIRLGTKNTGWVWPAIEMAGSGDITGNTVVNATYGAILYRADGKCYGNARSNDAANPWRGWLDFPDGHASNIGANADLAEPPVTPPWPARISY